MKFLNTITIITTLCASFYVWGVPPEKQNKTTQRTEIWAQEIGNKIVSMEPMDGIVKDNVKKYMELAYSKKIESCEAAAQIRQDYDEQVPKDIWAQENLELGYFRINAGARLRGYGILFNAVQLFESANSCSQAKTNQARPTS